MINAHFRLRFTNALPPKKIILRKDSIKFLRGAVSPKKEFGDTFLTGAVGRVLGDQKEGFYNSSNFLP